MKKYVRLTCDTCKRDIDKLIDLGHYAPDKCVITLGCEGRLFPIEYKSNGTIATTPEVGITDWRPRGSAKTTTYKDAAPVFIDLACGTKKQIVLAVLLASAPVAGTTITVPFTVKSDAPKAYRQYTFRRDSAFSSISGVESGLEKKTLRFTAYGTASSPVPDFVEVYVNGVKREQGTSPDGFQVYDGTATSAIPPNTISFNTPIILAGTTQIDVIVSKAETGTNVSLTFVRNTLDESRAGTGAWENVDYIQKFDTGWSNKYLFTCDLDTNTSLTLNTILTASGVMALSTFDTVPLSAGELLLSTQPYSILDRYTDISVPLEGMSTDRDYLKYYAIDGDTTLRVTDTQLLTSYPPFRVGKFSVEKTIKTQIPGVEEQIVVDGKVITGPDS